jgi:hypothetical protein
VAHPVLHRERVPGPVGPLVLGYHRFPVVGMDQGHPQPPVFEEGFGRVAEQLPDLGAHEAQRAVAHGPGALGTGSGQRVGDRRHLLDQGPVAVFGLGQLPLGLLLFADLQEYPLPVQRPAVGVADQDRFVAEPDRVAVFVDHAVLDGERLAGAVGPLVLLQDALAVVGVQQVLPELRVRTELLRRVAEHPLYVRAAVHGGVGLVGRVDVDDRRQALYERPVDLTSAAAEFLYGVPEGSPRLRIGCLCSARNSPRSLANIGTCPVG